MKLKYIFIFTIVFIKTEIILSQNFSDYEGYWLPHSYINELLINGFSKESSKFIRPIHCIHIKGNDIDILTYNGEFNKTKYNKIERDSLLSFELISVKNQLNLESFNRNEFINHKFILTFSLHNIFLEIISPIKTDTIQFINQYQKYIFADPFITSETIVFSGIYEIKNSLNNNICNNVKFDLSGIILNWNDFKSYTISRVYLPSSIGSNCHIIQLESINTTQEFAIIIKQKIIDIYDFKSDNKCYQVNIVKKRYILSKKK